MNKTKSFKSINFTAECGVWMTHRINVIGGQSKSESNQTNGTFFQFEIYKRQLVKKTHV